MAMTRKQLRELGLDGEMIERLIQMHTETVDGLKAERDALRAAADSSEALRRERDRLLEQLTAAEIERDAAVTAQQEAALYRERQEADKQRREAEEALTAALMREGANPQAIPLLLRAADLTAEGGPEAAIGPLKELYAAFFSQPMKLCTEQISPPLAPALAMTREALQVMDADEINRNWDAVKTALQEVNL